MKKILLILLLPVILLGSSWEKETKNREQIRWQKIAKICQFYHEKGTLEQYQWLTPGFLYKVIRWGETYSPLAKGYNYDTLNPENFYLRWCSQETNFCPYASVAYINENGEIDYFMMSINQIHRQGKAPHNLYRVIDKIYPELAKRPDSDPEKNVAVWFLWLGRQKYPDGWTCWRIWKRTRPEVIELYDMLKEVK